MTSWANLIHRLPSPGTLLSHAQLELKHALVGVLRRALGRRHLVRLSRYLLDQARLDVPNDIDSNGEHLVQSIAAASFKTNGRFVVFDVGANSGQWSTALIRTLNKDLRSGVVLYSFEPGAAPYLQLVATLKTLGVPGRAHAVPLALSDKSGTRALYKPHEGAGSSSLHKDDRFRYPSEDVSVSTLDSYCDSVGVSHINLLKIDAEGDDLSVLRGAAALLRRQDIDVVQFEYNYRWIFARSYLRDAFRFIAPFGYTIGKVTPEGIEFYDLWDQELETFREANYLACPQCYSQLFPTIPWWNAAKAH